MSGIGYGEVVYFAHHDHQGLGVVEDYGYIFHAVAVEIGPAYGARVSSCQSLTRDEGIDFVAAVVHTAVARCK